MNNQKQVYVIVESGLVSTIHANFDPDFKIDVLDLDLLDTEGIEQATLDKIIKQYDQITLSNGYRIIGYKRGKK